VSQSEHRFEIGFDSASAVEAGKYADELRRYILDAAPEVEIERIRTDPEAQDFGTSLAVILASPAIIAVAQGIRMWLARRSSSKVKLKVGNRVLEVDNIRARDAATLAHELSAMTERQG
jgi:hypothetical protein